MGSPYDYDSFGCYSNVICKCLDNIGIGYEDYTQMSFQNAINELENGIPVLLWTTMYMEPVLHGSSTWYCDNGTFVSWKGNEHCMVLVGYNTEKETFILADPLSWGLVEYDMGIFFDRWNDMGRQIIAVYGR